jgi:ATP-dependent protease ClpP protease subunit
MILIILFLLFNTVNSNNFINYINSIDIINIKGEINNNLYNKLINYKLTNDKYINIYIKSHGGNLLDAINIIYLIKEFEKNKTVICIAEIAYSVAFTIFQSCKNRYILSDSVLMQHEFIIINNNYDINIINSIIYYIRYLEANKLNIKLSLYLEKVKNELWLFGQDILNNNAADKLINF